MLAVVLKYTADQKRKGDGKKAEANNQVCCSWAGLCSAAVQA